VGGEHTVGGVVEEPAAHELAVGASLLGGYASGGQGGDDDGGEADHFEWSDGLVLGKLVLGVWLWVGLVDGVMSWMMLRLDVLTLRWVGTEALYSNLGGV
jgi:hypothetical protein